MIEGQLAAPKHPKAALQEWALARKRRPPEYRLVRREGPDHAPRFRVAVSIGKIAEAEGEGASKQAAEKVAAAALLARLAEEERTRSSGAASSPASDPPNRDKGPRAPPSLAPRTGTYPPRRRPKERQC